MMVHCKAGCAEAFVGCSLGLVEGGEHGSVDFGGDPVAGTDRRDLHESSTPASSAAATVRMEPSLSTDITLPGVGAPREEDDARRILSPSWSVPRRWRGRDRERRFPRPAQRVHAASSRSCRWRRPRSPRGQKSCNDISAGAACGADDCIPPHLHTSLFGHCVRNQDTPLSDNVSDKVGHRRPGWIARHHFPHGERESCPNQ